MPEGPGPTKAPQPGSVTRRAHGATPRSDGSTCHADHPARRQKPHLLEGLGLIGLDDIEPVVVAAAAAELPMLLVGPHGTGKSLLLTRVAQALGLTWRHYNASLLSYDDLIGYPVPDGSGGLEYLRTPATIWGAEAVFLDEINRCRPDLQNKLFPIVHERRVQGIELTELAHRWAAMNPVDQSAADDPYLGAEPLDAALADRFAFIVPMPDWRALTPKDQDRLLLSDLQPIEPAAAERFREAVVATRERYLEAIAQPGLSSAVYVRHALRLLDAAELRCSARRGTTLVRAIAAVRATGLLPDDKAAFVALRLGPPTASLGWRGPRTQDPRRPPRGARRRVRPAGRSDPQPAHHRRSPRSGGDGAGADRRRPGRPFGRGGRRFRRPARRSQARPRHPRLRERPGRRAAGLGRGAAGGGLRPRGHAAERARHHPQRAARATTPGSGSSDSWPGDATRARVC